MRFKYVFSEKFSTPFIFWKDNLKFVNMNDHKIKAILVDVISPDTSREEAAKRLEELESLVTTFGGVVVVKTIQKRGMPDYETYIGKGKVGEIAELAEEHEAKVLIVNNILKPGQIYNLNERLKKVHVEAWDRIDLILKIFEKHAQSSEAKLQIELARIRHMGPRIMGMGTELMRQAGSIGVRAGQGESNIEIMKRHLKKQEQNIMKKLEHYDVIGHGHRQMRKRKNFKTAALVGYTNAGKSSIMKALTGKKVYVADKLFATLGTNVGKLYIPAQHVDGQYVPGNEILISDTIGFIQELPPSLIQAFKSTLAETIEADIILHVIDITDPQIEMKIRVVEEILDQLGLSDRPKIYIFNKIDLINHSELVPEEEEFDESNRPSLLKAGRHTAKLLGWTSAEEKEKRKHQRLTTAYEPEELSEKYQHFSPVFVSAHEKLNLHELIEVIQGKI